MENKGHENLSLYTHTHVCVHRHEPTYVARVLERYEMKVLYIKAKVLNESYIVWEPFQTPIFQLYKDLHGLFQKHTENLKGKLKIH